MERLLRQNPLSDAFAIVPGLFAGRIWRKIGSAKPYDIIWWVFAASVTISMTSRFAGAVAAPLSYLLAIGGAAGCGWLWLLSRTLFRADKPVARWNLFVIAAIVAVEAYWDIVGASTANGAPGELRRIAANAASFICIGALVLVFVEVLSGYSAQLPKHEKRFRQIFTGVFGATVAVALLWALNANENTLGGQWADAALMACAIIGVVGARMAVSFRQRHPLAASRSRKGSPASSPAANDKGLAQRILHAIEREQQFTTPDLKVADLAAALGEQEYKVSQCITGSLGFRNFNHLINARRIDYAKKALAGPDNERRPILSIAFDCGFNSIGPFNRAFKQEAGMTPREFRTAIANGQTAPNDARNSDPIASG